MRHHLFPATCLIKKYKLLFFFALCAVQLLYIHAFLFYTWLLLCFLTIRLHQILTVCPLQLAGIQQRAHFMSPWIITRHCTLWFVPLFQSYRHPLSQLHFRLDMNYNLNCDLVWWFSFFFISLCVSTVHGRTGPITLMPVLVASLTASSSRSYFGLKVTVKAQSIIRPENTKQFG